MNVYASADGIAVVAELPGVEKDDLEVQAHRDTLTLRGDRRPPAEREEAYHRRERRSGPFTRSITLPYRIDPDRIEAQLENGVLRLSLPRPEEDKPRRIASAADAVPPMSPLHRTEETMPESPTATGPSRGRERGPEAERVPVAQPEGAERTRDRPVYAPRSTSSRPRTRSRSLPTCPA